MGTCFLGWLLLLTGGMGFVQAIILTFQRGPDKDEGGFKQENR